MSQVSYSSIEVEPEWLITVCNQTLGRINRRSERARELGFSVDDNDLYFLCEKLIQAATVRMSQNVVGSVSVRLTVDDLDRLTR